MLSSIEQLMRALDEHHIIYCHWKSNEHLGEALNGETDLDILFDPAQRIELERVFTECGLRRFRATPAMQYNAIEDFIGLDKETAKIWHVHTHYRMTLGENHLKGYTVTPWGHIILKNRIRGEADVWTSDPSDELVLLLCRIALKIRWRDLNQRLGKDDRTEIAWLKERVTTEGISFAIDRMIGEMGKEPILALYYTELEKKYQFTGLQKILRKEMKPFTSHSRFTSWVIRTNREIFWLYAGVKRRLGWDNYSATRRVSPSGGLVVAILGCDGAGKSTTLSYIKKEFNKKLDVVSIYFGSGDGSSSILRRPMKMVAKRVGGKGIGHAVEREYAEKKKVSFKARLYLIAKVLWAVVLAKEKRSKQRHMVKARNNGLLVLTDRYPQSDIPGSSDGPLLDKYKDRNMLMKKISSWEQKIYKSFSINAPDLTIKLTVQTDIAIARKPEMTVEEIEKKKSIVMGMDISAYSAVIDTSRPFEITCGEVMEEIWKLI